MRRRPKSWRSLSTRPAMSHAKSRARSGQSFTVWLASPLSLWPSTPSFLSLAAGYIAAECSEYSAITSLRFSCWLAWSWRTDTDTESRASLQLWAYCHQRQLQTRATIQTGLTLMMPISLISSLSANWSPLSAAWSRQTLAAVNVATIRTFATVKWPHRWPTRMYPRPLQTTSNFSVTTETEKMCNWTKATLHLKKV